MRSMLLSVLSRPGIAIDVSERQRATRGTVMTPQAFPKRRGMDEIDLAFLPKERLARSLAHHVEFNRIVSND